MTCSGHDSKMFLPNRAQEALLLERCATLAAQRGQGMNPVPANCLICGKALNHPGLVALDTKNFMQHKG